MSLCQGEGSPVLAQTGQRAADGPGVQAHT